MPYRLEFTLETGPGWITTRLDVTTRGDGPNLSGLILVPIVMLAVGGLISFATAMRLPHRRKPPANGPSSPGDER